MKVLSLSVISLLLVGCEMMQHVTCAPRYMVELCLQEAWAESNHTGLGPHCTTLNEWGKVHHWAVGGTTVDSK